MNSIQDILNAFREKRAEQEKRFLEWVKARDDDWWEDEARISIWDFRIMQEFFNEDFLTTLTEFEREVEKKYQDRVRMMGYVDSNNDIQMLDKGHVKEIVKMVVIELEKEKRT